MVAQPAGRVDAPRAAADRPRWPAHRRADHRASTERGPQRPDRQHDLPRPARQRHLQAREGRRLPELAGPHTRTRRRSSTARTTTASRSPNRSTCARSPAASTGPTRRRRRPRGSSRSARSSARPPSSSYLGTQFDPNSRFTVSMLWSGDKAWRQSGERRMLCGLQLPGPNNQQLAFKGKVADVDQSKVWPAGTCLGIDPSTNQPTDIPIDCAAPHAMEVTGAVNLAEKFPAGLPPEPEQDGFIKDACTRMTDAYLAPIQLRSTTLTLIYSTISLPSWSAGSHQVSCSIGATLGNGGWSTLLNSAKGPLADQRSAADSAARHPRGTAQLPADPDARRAVGRRRHHRRRRRRPATSPTTATRPSTCRSRRVRHQTRPKPRRPPRRRPRRATRSSTGLRHRRVSRCRRHLPACPAATRPAPPPPPAGPAATATASAARRKPHPHRRRHRCRGRRPAATTGAVTAWPCG